MVAPIRSQSRAAFLSLSFELLVQITMIVIMAAHASAASTDFHVLRSTRHFLPARLVDGCVESILSFVPEPAAPSRPSVAEPAHLLLGDLIAKCPRLAHNLVPSA